MLSAEITSTILSAKRSNVHDAIQPKLPAKVTVSHSGIQDVMCKLCMRNSIPVLQKSMLYTTMQMNSYKTASTYSA
jgi:hypothetical protein